MRNENKKQNLNIWIDSDMFKLEKETKQIKSDVKVRNDRFI